MSIHGIIMISSINNDNDINDCCSFITLECAKRSCAVFAAFPWADPLATIYSHTREWFHIVEQQVQA